MPLKMIDCQDCGEPIVIWGKQVPLCYKCQQKRDKEAFSGEKNRVKTAKATGTVCGLDQWILKYRLSNSAG